MISRFDNATTPIRAEYGVQRNRINHNLLASLATVASLRR